MHPVFLETAVYEHIDELHVAADRHRLASRGEPYVDRRGAPASGWLLARGERLRRRHASADPRRPPR